MANKWRVGRSLGRTLYIQLGPEPSKNDIYIGIMETKALAELVVKTHNLYYPFTELDQRLRELGEL